MKYDFGNQYAYFSEDIDEHFPWPLLDELYIHVFVDSDHGHNKVTGRLITKFFSVLESTLTTWSSKLQTAVQASTFGAEFTALNKAAKEYIMLRYHLISMEIKVSKPTPIFVDNMSVVLNATNTGSNLKKKTVAIS